MDRLLPQAVLLLAGVATFLPWRKTVGQETLRGIELGEGPLVLIAVVVGIALVQVGLRPAWMAPGFIVAVAGRQVIGGVEPDQLRYGAIVTLVLAAIAMLLLILAMFTAVNRPLADASSG